MQWGSSWFLYRIVGPVAITIMLIMFLVGVGKMAIEVLVRGYTFLSLHRCGLWMFKAFWSPLFHLAMTPFNYGWDLGGKAGRGVGKAMEVEAEANAARRRNLQWATADSANQKTGDDTGPWVNWRRAMYAPLAHAEAAKPALIVRE